MTFFESDWARHQQRKTSSVAVDHFDMLFAAIGWPF